MLWLALHLPQLPLEIFTRGAAAAEALVVSEGRGRDRRVCHANTPARRAGAAPGLALDAALALSDRLQVRARDARAEQAALAGLARWALQFTSFVDCSIPQALLLEIGGSLRLFGGVAPLCRAIERGVIELGWSASLAVAPTPLGAVWLARANAGARITDMKRLTGALFPLPLASLDLSEAKQQTLHGIGVRTLGECLRLPRDGLARRLGKEVVAMFDRALGLAPDPRTPYVPPAHYEGRLMLPVPVDNAEALAFALHRLLIELAGFLTARSMGVQCACIRLHHSDRTARSHLKNSFPSSHTFSRREKGGRKSPLPAMDRRSECRERRDARERPGEGEGEGMFEIASSEFLLDLASPTRDAAHLLNLLRERLVRTVLKAAVEEVSLESRVLCELGGRNNDFFIRARDEPESRTALIERLTARLGHEAVQGVGVVAEHRPEYAWRYVAPGTSAGEGATGQRPVWLLPTPLRLECRDGAPYLDGRLLLQPDCERIESGWWDGGDIRRDYFIARNDSGMRFWVFREFHGERRWFVHGVFG